MEYKYFDNVFVKRVLNCRNIDEVHELIEKEKHAILLKSFDSEIVVFVILVKDNVYFKNVGVYFNLENKNVEVVLASSRTIKNFNESFQRLHKTNEGEVVIEFKNGVEKIELLYGHPPGDSFKMNIENGSWGGGNNWTRAALGIE